MICLRQLNFAEIENWESLLQEMFADFEITLKQCLNIYNVFYEYF